MAAFAIHDSDSKIAMERMKMMTMIVIIIIIIMAQIARPKPKKFMHTSKPLCLQQHVQALGIWMQGAYLDKGGFSQASLACGEARITVVRLRVRFGDFSFRV